MSDALTWDGNDIVSRTDLGQQRYVVSRTDYGRQRYFIWSHLHEVTLQDVRRTDMGRQ